MKKNLLILVVLMLILLVIGFIFKNSKPKEEITNIVESEITPEDMIVADSYKEIVLKPDDPYVDFDVKYPSFITYDESFNTGIETFVKNKMDEHQKISQENWMARYDTQIEGDNISKVPKKDEKFSFFTDYTLAQSNSSYISFILRYGGFSGGAHGYEEIISFNYDSYIDKPIELKDLFPEDEQYLITLSNASREYLKKQFATVSEEEKKNSSEEAIKEYLDNINSMIDSGTEPKLENFNTFTFTRDRKIKIYFAQYQVGPYVIGTPEFEMDIK